MVDGIAGVVCVMLSEQELKELIKNQKEVNEQIVDINQRDRHRQFILGLECVLNE